MIFQRKLWIFYTLDFGGDRDEPFTFVAAEGDGDGEGDDGNFFGGGDEDDDGGGGLGALVLRRSSSSSTPPLLVFLLCSVVGFLSSTHAYKQTYIHTYQVTHGFNRTHAQT